MVHVEELDADFIAEDTGGAIRGRRIDVYMDSVQEALTWGIRQVRVRVYPKI
jgi:3D (Asp-Asp-Asp) domain-containing protein